MQSKLGAKVVSLFERIEFVSVKDATRLGRKTTRMTVVLTTDFTFTFNCRVSKKKVHLRPAIQLS